MGRTVRLDANVSAIIKASTPLRGRFRFSDRYAMVQRAQIESDRDRTYTRGLAALDAYGVATGAQADATTALSAAGVAQAAAEAAQTDATGALILAGSKTRAYYQASAPSSGVVVGDLWFNTDTTTNCPDNNCKGHTESGGSPQVGAYPHRVLYWAHRYNAVWLDANRSGLLIASEIAAGAIVADKIAAGAISADKMAASAVITSDYHETTSTVYPEGTSGTWADTGAKMFNNTTGGTPIRVSPQGLRVGRWRLDEPIVRATTTLASDGSGSTGRAWYRGSNTDAQPYIGNSTGSVTRVTVTRRKFDTTNRHARFDVKIQPESDSDNLDALRYLKVAWYSHDTAGNNAQASAVELLTTTYHTLPDRRYKTPGTDSDSGNAIWLTIQLVDSGLTTADAFPALVLQVFGVKGESDGLCFYSTSGTDGTNLVCSGTAWPSNWASNAPPEPDPGGGSGGGGACPAPETKVRMADGSFKEAGALVPGDKVYTAHETTLAWGVYTVSFAQVEEPAARVRMVLDDDRELVCSPGHRVLTEAGWRQVATLPPGVTIKGATSGVVRSVEPWPAGPVVKLVVDGASTWLSHDGILNHNMKIVE